MVEKYLTNKNTWNTRRDTIVFQKRSADGAHEPRRVYPRESGNSVVFRC